jgi:predicted DNA-binding protein (UPF0251 family)
MNADLEALLKAMQAIRETREEEELEKLKRAYGLLLDEAAERLGVSQSFLEQAVFRRRRAWLKAQTKHPSIPPKA